jgi:hypothetical protein
MRAAVRPTGFFAFVDVGIGVAGAAFFASVVVASGGCAECNTDQDCAAKLGTPDLLCVEGSCTSGSPDVAAAPPCSRDADCDDGEICFDDACVIVPTCQQVVGNFIARRVGTGELGEVAATTDGCEVTLSVSIGTGPGAIDVDVSADHIERDGAWVEPRGFTGGTWTAGARVGVLEGLNSDTIVFGTEQFACIDDVDCAGQVRETCRTACAGGFGCADGAPCGADGLCAAATRGTCR